MAPVPSLAADLPICQGMAADRVDCDSPLATDASPLLSVLLPVYNERATVLQLLRQVVTLPVNLEVIVVDDGSTDGTFDLLAAESWPARVRLLRHGINRGKGAAVRTALALARGEFSIVQDGDLEYDPRQIPLLLEPLREGTARVVYGSRYLNGTAGQPFRWLRWGVWGLNQVVRLLFGVHLTDCATCYKCLPTQLLRELSLEEERFGFCAEVTAKLCRGGIPITEVLIHYTPRTSRHGKKLRAWDGWEALWIYWRHRRWKPPAGMRSVTGSSPEMDTAIVRRKA